MYELTVKSHFSAAHRLVGYQGACANFHGHNWEVEIAIRGRRLNEIGILVDFRDIKRAVRAAMETLDHSDLNALPAFMKENPSSENLARHLHRQLSEALNTGDYRIHRVTVCETPGSAASYWNDGADGDG